MDDLERLRSQAFLATNHIAELQAQLARMEQENRQLAERLTLSDDERKILAGHEDGCVRVRELRPILRRIFGDAA